MIRPDFLIDYVDIYYDGTNLDKIKSGDIVGCHVLNSLRLNQLIDRPITLVTENADLGLVGQPSKVNGATCVNVRTNSDTVFMFELSPYITRWFSTNVANEIDRVIAVPLGTIHHEELTKYLQNKPNPAIVKSVYANFGEHTFYRYRHKVLEHAKTQEYCTVVEPTENRNLYNDLDSYWTSVLCHWANLCPQGNSFDTYRVWETIALCRMPIVDQYFPWKLPHIKANLTTFEQENIVSGIVCPGTDYTNYEELQESYWINLCKST